METRFSCEVGLHEERKSLAFPSLWRGIESLAIHIETWVFLSTWKFWSTYLSVFFNIYAEKLNSCRLISSTPMNLCTTAVPKVSSHPLQSLERIELRVGHKNYTYLCGRNNKFPVQFSSQLIHLSSLCT